MTAVGSYPMRSDAAELAEMLLWAAGIPYSTVADDAYPSDRRRRVLFLVGDADANDAVALLTDQLRTTSFGQSMLINATTAATNAT